MNHLDELIQQEDAKLRVLKEEVARREQRIAVLKEMKGEGNELDRVLASSVSSKPNLDQTAFLWAPSTKMELPKQRPKGQVKHALLFVMSRSPMPIEEVQGLVKNTGMELSYNRVRTQLWTLSKDPEGLVASPAKGCYQLTEQGEAYVEKLKGESPVAAGFLVQLRLRRTNFDGRSMRLAIARPAASLIGVTTVWLALTDRS